MSSMKSDTQSRATKKVPSKKQENSHAKKTHRKGLPEKPM